MNTFASSASPDLVHWHDRAPEHLISAKSLIQRFSQATHAALFGIQELVVETEYEMEQIEKYFDIHPFAHNFFGSLANTKLILHPNGILEIKREGQKESTRFPVQRRAANAANDEQFSLAA